MVIGLNKSTFWDVEIEKLDPEKNASFIIERVFQEGYYSELQQIIAYYGFEKIRKTLCEANWLDNKTMHLCSVLFNIKLTDFRCYEKKQLSPTHWEY